jgi:hypothetical protein
MLSLPRLSGAGQNPSRPSVTAGQPIRKVPGERSREDGLDLLLTVESQGDIVRLERWHAVPMTVVYGFANVLGESCGLVNSSLFLYADLGRRCR